MKILSRLLRKRSSAATIDLASPAVGRNPFTHYEDLRRAGPVQYLTRDEAWIVLGYDEVQSAFGQPQIFSNRAYAEVDPVLLAADPPDHAAVRRLVARHFSADAIDRLVAFAESHAQTLLKPRMDAVAEYAVPLSAAVAGQLLGFDDGHLAAIRAVRDLEALFRTIDGIADGSAMYAALTGDGLDDRQARSLVRLLWLAATSTTERAIAHCVLRLLLHEEARDPAMVPAFVEEVLRLHPPELLVPRVATSSVQLGGATIPANAAVYLCVAAANRDPAKFERPADLWLDRPPARIFSFGSGIHHCVGATLGRRVIQAAVQTLLARTPAFRAAQPLDDVVGWCSRTASPVARLLIEGVR